jgi:allophanate hydrolase
MNSTATPASTPRAGDIQDQASVTQDQTSVIQVQTSVERVERAYERIREVDRPEVWITLRSREDARSDATAIDAAVAAGAILPLAGTVCAVKDNIDVAGLPTTAASPEFSYFPGRNATAVQRLIDAGAVVIGKTNLDQFATGLVGTRSPYGAVRNSRFPDRVSGGSSAGSAVATALGIVDFALATDTAGSGRVPAAFNGLAGIKSTLGLVPTTGVVPACPSYDAVTVLAPTLAEAQAVTSLITGVNGVDPHERSWPADVRLAAPRSPVVALPADEQLSLLSTRDLDTFRAQVQTLTAAGAITKVVDISPMLECARLLYDSALVAERYAAFGVHVESATSGVDPVVASIVARAKSVLGSDVIRDQQRVLEIRLQTEGVLRGCDVLLLPTAPFHPTMAQVDADPVGVNSQLGMYTNFVNLLDMAAVSVPAGDPDGDPGSGLDSGPDGGLFGVSVIARAFDDQVAIDVAAILTGETIQAPFPNTGVPVVVFGAHMSGLPLNHQLETLGARRMRDVQTAPRYRMVALPGEPARPGVYVSDTGSSDSGLSESGRSDSGPVDSGASLPGELWLLSPAGLGTLLAGLPAPMTLGRIQLDDGSEVLGFGCSAPDGPDITRYGGWRSYLTAQNVTAQNLTAQNLTAQNLTAQNQTAQKGAKR